MPGGGARSASNRRTSDELRATPESIRAYRRQSYYDGHWKPAYETLITYAAATPPSPGRPPPPIPRSKLVEGAPPLIAVTHVRSHRAGDEPGMTWAVKRRAPVAAMMGCLLVMGGCAVATEPRDEDDVVLGTVTDPLTVGAVKWLNGTYAGCLNRTGAWSARVSGSATMDNPALGVTKNDTGCKLAITGLVADQSYLAVTPILLGTSYPVTPTAFVSAGGTILGNARLESAAFDSDFQLTFVYAGDDPPVTSASVSGAYAAVSSSSVSAGVLPPTYALDVDKLKFTADPIQILVGVTGYAVLNDGLVTGSAYAIDGTLGGSPTYGQTAAAFAAAALSQKAITTTNQQIPASEFGILALSLLGSTQVRNVIVRRTVAGVTAYQILRVTFYS